MNPGDPRPSIDGSRASAWLLGALAVWAVATALALLAARPPAPLPSDAPAHLASGSRAFAVLQRLARTEDGRPSPPRPPGTEANARTADAIANELRRLGVEPEIDVRFGFSRSQRAAGTMRNVVARLPGRARLDGPRESILCMAHHDSVGAGPGIGDDLAGVAALLEAARALQHGPRLERDVILLFEDGEEHGLLGAELFAQQHPWAERVGVVVNLEARGTSGPSRLFEFGPDSAWTLGAYASQATRPSTTSVSAEIYRRMPNDTDYSIWRERGIPG